jgi:hypothetical protein
VAAYHAANPEKIAARKAAYNAARRAQDQSYQFIATAQGMAALKTAVTKTSKGKKTA